jgi:hypothetical protein
MRNLLGIGASKRGFPFPALICGGNPDLQAFAKNPLPPMQMHWQMTQQFNNAPAIKYEVGYGSQKFGVSVDALKAAIKKVGNLAEAVENELAG